MPRVLAVIVCAVLSSSAAAQPPEVVEVVRPVVREVPETLTVSGLVRPAESVSLRARVTGYLQKVAAAEGAVVKKGDVLFEIDPRPYQAELDRADAAVALADARLKRAEAEFERFKRLLPAKAVTAEEYDLARLALDEAKANAMAARAARAVAALNVEYTRVVAPIDGRFVRPFVTAGNLVRADETALGELVGAKLFVSVDLPEATFLKLRRAMREGKAPALRFGIRGEDDGSRQAAFEGFAAEVDPAKATVNVRARPLGATADLLPGMFVLVKFESAAKVKAHVLPKTLLTSIRGEAGGVVVVTAADEIAARKVVIVRTDGDTFAVTGLAEGDRPLATKPAGFPFMTLRPGTKVKPVEKAEPKKDR